MAINWNKTPVDDSLVYVYCPINIMCFWLTVHFTVHVAMLLNKLQLNPSITAALGEWYFGCYTEVAVAEEF